MSGRKVALVIGAGDATGGAIETGKRLQPIAYASGEPQRTMAAFLNRKKG